MLSQTPDVCNGKHGARSERDRSYAGYHPCSERENESNVKMNRCEGMAGA